MSYTISALESLPQAATQETPGLQTLPAAASPTESNRHRVIDVHAGWGATAASSDWRNLDYIQSAMYSRGVGTVFVSSLLSRRYDLVDGNQALAEALRGKEDSEDTTNVRGWIVLHPAREAEVEAQMRRYLFQPRFVGAAIYADPLTGLPVSVRDAHHLTTAFRRYGKPLLVETPSAEAMVETIRIAEDMAGIKIIASGMGGDEWREATSLASRNANIWLDISGALVPEKIEYAINILHGTRKLLFASGAPHTDPAAFIGMLDDLNLGQEEKNRILYGNAERLFGLGPAVQEVPQLASLGGNEPVFANYLVGNVEAGEEQDS